MTRKNPHVASEIRTPDLPVLRWTPEHFCVRNARNRPTYALSLVFLAHKTAWHQYIFSHINNCVLTTEPHQKAGQVKASMPELYAAAAPDVWPGSWVHAQELTLPLSFTEQIRTLQGVSIAENANVKGLTTRPMRWSQRKRTRGQPIETWRWTFERDLKSREVTLQANPFSGEEDHRTVNRDVEVDLWERSEEQRGDSPGHCLRWGRGPQDSQQRCGGGPLREVWRAERWLSRPLPSQRKRTTGQSKGGGPLREIWRAKRWPSRPLPSQGKRTTGQPTEMWRWTTERDLKSREVTLQATAFPGEEDQRTVNRDVEVDLWERSEEQRGDPPDSIGSSRQARWRPLAATLHITLHTQARWRPLAVTLHITPHCTHRPDGGPLLPPCTSHHTAHTGQMEAPCCHLAHHTAHTGQMEAPCCHLAHHITLHTQARWRPLAVTLHITSHHITLHRQARWRPLAVTLHITLHTQARWRPLAVTLHTTSHCTDSQPDGGPLLPPCTSHHTAHTASQMEAPCCHLVHHITLHTQARWRPLAHHTAHTVSQMEAPCCHLTHHTTLHRQARWRPLAHHTAQTGQMEASCCHLAHRTAHTGQMAAPCCHLAHHNCTGLNEGINKISHSFCTMLDYIHSLTHKKRIRLLWIKKKWIRRNS